MLKIQVIIGSTRPKRFSEKPAQWILDELSKITGVEVEMVDLRDWPLAFFETDRSPSMYGDEYPNDTVKKWATKIKEADGYVVVTPEYNHGYPAVLKNAIDHAFKEWHKKPVAFVSYGSAGGARVVEQLRQVFAELHMVTIRDAVLINWDTYMAVSSSPEVKRELFDPVQAKADVMLKELVWWGNALKTAREK